MSFGAARVAAGYLRGVRPTCQAEELRNWLTWVALLPRVLAWEPAIALTIGSKCFLSAAPTQVAAAQQPGPPKKWPT